MGVGVNVRHGHGQVSPAPVPPPVHPGLCLLGPVGVPTGTVVGKPQSVLSVGHRLDVDEVLPESVQAMTMSILSDCFTWGLFSSPSTLPTLSLHPLHYLPSLFTLYITYPFCSPSTLHLPFLFTLYTTYPLSSPSTLPTLSLHPLHYTYPFSSPSTLATLSLH